MNVKYSIVFLLTAFTLILLPATSARASAERVWAHQSQSVEGPYECKLIERNPTSETWDCQPGFATDHDVVHFTTSEPIDAIALGEMTRLNPELSDVVVSFDVGADGKPNLILHQWVNREGHAIADYYDDQNGNGVVDYQLDDDSQPLFLEPGPVIRIVARDGWFHNADGLTNFNLDIFVDGPVRATFGYLPQFLDLSDGSPDVEIFVRDVDHDGRPDYEWRQYWPPLPESYHYGYVRTEITVNTVGNEKPITGWFITPFLSLIEGHEGYFVKRGYETSPPPVTVDWNEGRITHFIELVTSRHNPGNYFVYTIARASADNSPTHANFENPFAFYDLSGQGELIPNLMICNAHFPNGDPFFAVEWGLGWAQFASNDLSYTWRLPTKEPVSDPIWDYKINLIGRHDYTHVERFEDISILTADYGQMPEWVLSRQWDSAAFVADEGANIANDEGIAIWGSMLGQNAPESYEYV
ncbi:MAG TPA: hypothetical protein PKJ56_07400, partial [Promineifilum sp.]|nr:hypothetical protein [Promineifilum sp.]